MTRALIFGINGQDGYYLKSLLCGRGIEVEGVSRSSGDWLCGDVADFSFVENLIAQRQPDFIFHLAADSTTRHEALFRNHAAISTGTLNILESVKRHVPACRVFLSGSAMQFRNDGSGIDEQTPFEASSPYAVARIQSVYAARYYRQVLGIKAYVGYFFNHDSPLRSERHVNQKIVMAVKRIAAGSNEKLILGDISVEKEFNFAADIVEAVWILVNQNDVFEAVIGSGKTYSIQDWLINCFRRTDKRWEDCVEVNQGFISEYKRLLSNPAVIKSLGWQPKVDFSRLADIMMAEA